MKQGITRLRSVIFFACFLLALFSGQNLLSQAAQQPAASVDSTAAPIVPFALSEISQESNNTITLANKLGSSRIKEDELAAFISDLDSFLIPVDTFLLDTTYRNLEKFTNWDLEKTTNRINLYLGQITLNEAQISRPYKNLEANYNTLQALKERWQITQDELRDTDIQETLVGRIDMALRAIDSVNTFLQSDMAQLLLLTDRLLDRQNKFNTLKDNVQEALLALSQNMFKKDNRILSKDLYQLRDSTIWSSHMRTAGKSIRSDLEVFKSDFPHVLRTTIILFVILMSFLTWFSFNYKTAISQNKLNLKEVQRHLIISPLLTGTFSTFIIIHFAYPELPFTIGVINLLILSIPIAMLAIRFMGKGVQYWVIWSIVSYLLTLIYRLSFAPDILQRIFLLLLSATGMVMYGWMLINKESHHLFKKEAGHKLERALAISFLSMMIAGFIANLAGFFSLASFLTIVPFQISFLLVAVKVLIYFTDLIFYLLLGSNFMLRINAVSDFFLPIYRRISSFVMLFFVIFFFMNTLQILRVKDIFLNWGGEVLTNTKEIGQASFSLENILVFVFVIWLSVFITKIVRYILEKDVFVRVSTSKGVPDTIIMMVRIILISVGFLLAAAAAGIALNNLSIIIGAFSVGIGFGLQNIFNNMVSGLILAFERPINVGDVVQVGTLMGTVKHMGLRASKVKSFDGAEVIVPNGNLISDLLINWTLSDAYRRMDIRIGVAYGTDPQVILDIMMETAKEHKIVRKDPPPSTYFVGFGDNSLDFRLLAWVDVDNRLSVESELHLTINEKINDAGIEIPFPQHDLHIRSDDTRTIEEASSKSEAKAKPKPKAEHEAKAKPEAKAKGEDPQDYDGGYTLPME